MISTAMADRSGTRPVGPAVIGPSTAIEHDDADYN
jgi:hypothetical protein